MKKLMFPKGRKMIALVLAMALTIAGIGVSEVAPEVKAAEKQVKTTRAVQPKAEAKAASGAALTVANIIEDEKLVDSGTALPGTSGKARPIADGDTMTLYVGVSAGTEFAVEVRETGKCLTTSTFNKNAWYWSDPASKVGDDPVKTAGAAEFAVNHVYRVTVKREGGKYTIMYYDATTGQDYNTVVADNTTLTGTPTVNVAGVNGTYIVGEKIVPIAANVVEDEKLVSAGDPWVWGKNRSIEGNTMTLYVGVSAGTEFIVEVRDGSKCLSTSSLKTAWYYAEGGTTGDALAITQGAATFAENHVYRVTVKREGSKYTLTYYDATTGQDYNTVVADNTNMTGAPTVNVTAVNGTYIIGTEIGVPAAEPGTVPIPDPTPVSAKMIAGAKEDAVFLLGADIIPGEGDRADVTWASSNTDVATVNNGVITAKAAGDTNISATIGEETVTKPLTVIDSMDEGAWNDAKNLTRDGHAIMQVGEDGVYLQGKAVSKNGTWFHAPILGVDRGGSDAAGDRIVGVRSDNWVIGNPNFSQWSQGVSPDPGDWSTLAAELAAGARFYYSAVKVGDAIRVRTTIGSYSKDVMIPIVDESQFCVYLFGEDCTITELQAVDKYHFNDPGPSIPVVPVYPGSVVTPKPVVTPGPAIDVPIGIENIKVENTLTGGKGWEDANWGHQAPDLDFSGKEVSTEIYVGASKLNTEGWGVFVIELEDNGKFLDVGSHLDTWTTGEVVIGNKETKPAERNDESLTEGHVYRVTITRKGNDIVVKYYDATAQKDFYEATVKGINFGDNVKFRVLGVVGTFDIGQQVTVGGDTPTTAPDVTAGPADPTTGPDVTAAPSAEPSKEPDASAAPSTAPSAEPSTEPSAEPDNNKGAETGSKVTVSGSTYKVNSGSQVTYTAKKKASKNVTVPATVKINGKTYKVTSIAANAFKGNNKIQKVTLSKNIAKIGKNAFSNCKKLKTIVIKSKKLKASGIAKNAFKGLTKKTVIKVPKAKKKAYQKLFRKKGLSKNVKVKAI